MMMMKRSLFVSYLHIFLDTVTVQSFSTFILLEKTRSREISLWQASADLISHTQTLFTVWQATMCEKVIDV